MSTYVNHAINFYLYCLTGSRFRQELCIMLGCRHSEDRLSSSRVVARTYSKRVTAAKRHNGEDMELEHIVN